MTELTTVVQSETSTGALIMNPGAMRALMDFAHAMADSTVTVPKHLQGKPSDCMAIAMQAAQWGMNPFAVAQKTHVVNGALGYEAQLVNAVIQSSKAITGSFQYDFEGDGPKVACRVGATIAGDSSVTWGEWLTADSVQTKNSPLWKTNPRQQLAYLQVKNWGRLYCPGAILGVYSTDELEQMPPTDMGAAEEVKQAGPRRRSEAAKADVVDAETGEVTGPETHADKPAAKSETEKLKAPAPTASTGGISAGQIAYLRNKLKSTGITEATITDRYQLAGIELLNAEQFDTVKSELLAMA